MISLNMSPLGSNSTLQTVDHSFNPQPHGKRNLSDQIAQEDGHDVEDDQVDWKHKPSHIRILVNEDMDQINLKRKSSDKADQ